MARRAPLTWADLQWTCSPEVKASAEEEGSEALDQQDEGQGKVETGLNEVYFPLIFGSVVFCIFGGRLNSLFLVKRALMNTTLMNTALAGSP